MTLKRVISETVLAIAISGAASWWMVTHSTKFYGDPYVAMPNVVMSVAICVGYIGILVSKYRCRR